MCNLCKLPRTYTTCKINPFLWFSFYIPTFLSPIRSSLISKYEPISFFFSQMSNRAVMSYNILIVKSFMPPHLASQSHSHMCSCLCSWSVYDVSTCRGVRNWCFCGDTRLGTGTGAGL